MSDDTAGAVVVGTGELYWQSGERISDRYGAVHLNQDDGRAMEIDASLVGKRGRLVAVIARPLPAFHLGDLARGLQRTGSVAAGDEYELGIGTLFVEPSRDGYTEVGVTPDNGRDIDWLNPAALYQCHGQLVRLELRDTDDTREKT